MADDRGEQVEVSIEIEASLEPATAAKPGQPDEEDVHTKTAPVAVDEEEVDVTTTPVAEEENGMKTTPSLEPGQPQSLSQGHSDPNTTQDGVHFRDCGIPDELVDFPRDDDGIIHLEDVQISKPTPLPSKLTGITKDDDPRLHRHVRRRHRQVKEPHSLPTFAVPILAGDDSAWDQVDAALKYEDREDILEKVQRIYCN